MASLEAENVTCFDEVSAFNNHTNCTLSEPRYVTSTDTEILRQTLRTYGSIYIALLVLFCYLRSPRGYPRLFNIRSWSSNVYSDISKQDNYGFVSWMWQVWRLDDDVILEHCGMDSLCFLRVLRLGRKLSLFGCFHALWLLPVYSTALTSKETAYLKDPLVKMSIANLPNESPRFLATLIAGYIIFGYVMRMILKEFQWYTRYRHKFLSLPRQARNYTIYVTGIPPEYRTSQALKDFFQDHNTHHEGAVLEAHILMDTPALDHLLAKREELQYALERTESQKEKLADHMDTSGEALSVQAALYKEQLEALDRKVTMKLHEIQHARYCPGTKSLVHNMGMQQFLECTSPVLSRASEEEEEEIVLPPSYPITLDQGASFESLRMPGSLEITETQRDDTDSTDTIADTQRDDTQSTDTSEVNDSSSATKLEEEVDDKDAELNERIDDIVINFQAVKDLKPNFESSCNNESQIQDHKSKQDFGSDSSKASEEEADDDMKSLDEGTMQNNPTMPKKNMLENTLVNMDLWDSEHSSPNLANDCGNSNSTSTRSSNMQPEENYTVQFNSYRHNSAGTSDRANQDLEALQSPCSSADLITVVLSDVTENKPWEEVSKVRVCESGTNPGDNDALRAKKRRRRLASEVAADDLEQLYLTKQIKARPKMAKPSAPADTSPNSEQSLRRKRQAYVYDPARTMIAKGGQIVASAGEMSAQSAQRVSNHISKSAAVVSDFGVHNIQKVGEQLTKTVFSAGEFGLTAASAVIPIALMGQERDGTPRDAGFVVFTNFYAKHVAMQILHHGDTDTMRVYEAPQPDEIFWNNVRRPDQAKRSGRLLSFFATLALCFFWTIPVAFLSSLTEVNSLKEKIPILADWIEEMPRLEVLLGLIAPLLLSVLQDVFLPEFLKVFGKWEGHISESTLEASLFLKLAVFMVIQTFFVSAISGSITAEIANILDTTGSLMDFLANSLPAQSSFHMQIVIVTVVLNMGLELLRVYPLGMALLGNVYTKVMMGCLGRIPDRRRSRAFCNGYIRSLDDPYEFEHAQILANTVVFFFMVFLVYTVVAPICNFCLAICFLLLESGYRYQLYHNYPSTPDSGGKLYKGFIHMIHSGMLIAQLTLIGLLLLKRSYYAVYGFGPLLGITVLFIWHVNWTKFHVTKHLPSRDCKRLDQRRRESGSSLDLSFLRQQYLQPSIRKATQQLHRASV